MSKKSRRRNQAVLAALGLGLALANRGKGMEDSNISVGGGKDAASMDTSLKMPKRKMGVIPKKMRSSVLADPRINKMDTSEVDIDFTPGVSKRIAGQSVMADPRLNTGAFDIGFKKGGRVGCGIAKKGYGKAMKKGKK
jgi:hypothetical protein